MLQLKNTTPFASSIALFPNENGVDTLYTMIKGSFKLEGSWVLSETQLPPQAEDEYWGEPGTSSIRLASDYHTGKPSTDVIVIGEAYAPEGRVVTQLDVEISVGRINKVIRVFGDRIWQQGKASAPKPFKTMPLVYERAFGGTHQIDEETCLSEERNPIGRGFKGKRRSSEFDGTMLPNIENPEELISCPEDCPQPVGVGYCSPDWLPRRSYAGTYDERWQLSQAPYLPQDFDPRFLNSAHPDLIYPGRLFGGEALTVKNMHPEGEIKALLPQVKILCQVNLRGKKSELPVNLETLIVEPNKKQVSMVWRAAYECDKKALEVNEIEIKLSR